MGYYWLGAGLLMGAGSALHCAAMCGPIMMATSSLFGQNKNLTKGLVFQMAGKTFTYVLIGLLFGFLGKLISLTVFQERLMLVAGLLLVLISLQGWFNLAAYTKASQTLTKWIGTKIKALIRYPFFIGLLHGLIPCGMVYAAGIASLASHSAINGGLFMLGFGLGTLPILVVVGLGAKKVFSVLRNKKWLQHVPSLLLGILFFVKGLGLDIPYLSPKVVAQNPKSCCSRNK